MTYADYTLHVRHVAREISVQEVVEDRIGTRVTVVRRAVMQGGEKVICDDQ
jgi:hypothetical protein